MTREVSTTEALMTDPTTPEGATYWQSRHDCEQRLEDETTICEVDGCGREFPDIIAWQEHYEDTHLDDEE